MGEWKEAEDGRDDRLHDGVDMCDDKMFCACRQMSIIVPAAGPKWMEHNEVQLMKEGHDIDAAAAAAADDDDESPAVEGKYTRIPEGDTCCSITVRHRNAQSHVNHHKGQPHSVTPSPAAGPPPHRHSSHSCTISQMIQV